MKPGRTAAGITILLLAGCAGRDYREPVLPAPTSWSASALDTAAVPLDRWWTCFREPALDAVVEQVLAANHDIRLAAERLREARAHCGMAEADLAPTVNAAAESTRSRTSSNGPQGRFAGGIRNFYQAGFDASWELDVFGGVRRGIEAAVAESEALAATVDDVRVSVAAEAVRCWLESRSAEARHAVARRLLANARRQSELVGRRRLTGLADGRAVADAAAAVAHAEAALPPLAANAALVRHRLSLLAGRTPDVDRRLADDAVLPASADIFALPVPAELIRRRPDLRRAERELAAATARIGVVEADLYPRISLTGEFGVQSISSRTLDSADSVAWSVGPSIRWPIFSAGRIRQHVQAAGSVAEQAAIRFEQVALRAYAEVEDALVVLANDRARERYCTAVVGACERSTVLQTDLRRTGLADGLSVLRHEAECLRATDDLLVARFACGAGLAALAKALGGGWESAAGDVATSR